MRYTVFLCIEEVDWNEKAVLENYRTVKVFLCIEEVDWNGAVYKLFMAHSVFLCIEEVDWNFVKPNLMQMYSRSSSVYRKCI
mgnify:CR=1 FL=1